MPPAGAVLLDATGDVAVAGDPQVPSPLSEPADLVALLIEESEESFEFRLETVVATDAARDAEVDVYFSWQNREFRLSFTTGGDDAERRCSLSHRSLGAQLWDSVARQAANVDGTVTVCTVARDVIQDSIGRSPASGDTFANVYATSEDGITAKRPVGAVPGPGEYIQIVDRMPDEDSGEYEVLMGGEDLPAMYLVSPEPFQFSNGEATAHVFPISIVNQGAVAHVELQVANVPEGWHVALPGPRALGEQEDVEVIAVVPFAHVHGETRSFDVQLVDSGNVVHSIPVGVHFFDKAQPSGHHPRVWVHTSQGAAAGTDYAQAGHFMNTLQSDDRDTGVALAARGHQDSTGATTWFKWCIPLEERLRIGLDQDMTRHGQFIVDVRSDFEYVGVLQAQVVVVANSDDESDSRFALDPTCRGRPVAVVAKSIPVEGFTPAGDLQLTLMPVLDELEPSSGRQVFLQVTYELDEPVRLLADPPRWAPGASFTLPLREYHATLREDAGSWQGGDREFQRRPGTTALFSATFTGPSGTYLLTAPGTHADWVQVLTPNVRPGDTAKIAVQVPPDATPQEIQHFVIASGPTTSMVRMTLVVDPDAPPDDDVAALSPQGKRSPANVGVTLMACVVLMAAERRLGARRL